MEITRVQALSQRIVQAYAWGDVVWHVWPTHSASEAMLTEGGIPKPVLVLLHGGSGSWTHWLRNIEHLSKYRTVWALDIPGFGDSSLPPGVIDADDLVPFMAEIFQQTFDGIPVDVMGFSFGGMTAGLLAAANPQVIRRLMLVGAPGLGLFGKVLPMRGMMPNMDRAEQRKVHEHNLAAMMFAHAQTTTEEVVDLQESNVARDRLRRRRIARTDVLASLQSKWTIQVDGVWGELDALYEGTLEQIPKVLTHLKTFTVVPDAGHWVMFEKPDAFHAAIEDFVKDC